jgi:UDP-N-acetylglucosamine 2-epimerase (non-hydrolysing)
VYPVHLNPQVRKPVYSLLANCRNLRLLPPLPYPSFIALLRRSRLLLTDSGGLQEEAPVLHKPVLVMRDHTERAEAVRLGAAKLIGTSRESIVRETTKLLTNRRTYEAMAHAPNPFGDGRASQRIAGLCLSFLERRGHRR